MLNDPDIEWGTVGEWVSGVGTLLAVITTFVVILHQSRAGQRTRAGRLFFELIPKNVRMGDTAGTVYDSIQCWQVVCRNNTDDSFFSIVVTLHVGGRTISERIFDNVEPFALGPRMSEGFFIDDQLTPVGQRASAMTAKYVDVDGTTWKQGLNGHLERVPWWSKS